MTFHRSIVVCFKVKGIFMPLHELDELEELDELFIRSFLVLNVSNAN